MSNDWKELPGEQFDAAELDGPRKILAGELRNGDDFGTERIVESISSRDVLRELFTRLSCAPESARSNDSSIVAGGVYDKRTVHCRKIGVDARNDAKMMIFRKEIRRTGTAFC